MTLTQAMCCEKDFTYRINELEHEMLGRNSKTGITEFIETLRQRIEQHLIFGFWLVSIEGKLEGDGDIAITIDIAQHGLQVVTTIKHTVVEPQWLDKTA